MHFLFICSIFGPTTGGIQTLIARMSKWLIEKGYRITLLSNEASRYRVLFPNEIRIIDLGEHLRDFCYYHKAKGAWNELSIDRPDVIKSFSLRDSWISSILSSFIVPAPKVLFGNYFPFIFPQNRNPFSYFAVKPYLINLVKNFDNNSILCMDNEQIAQFRYRYGQHRNPVFWPLPVDNPNKHGLNRTPEWCHIISIARLEPMKRGIFHTLEVVGKLRSKGYPVKWTVYGEGSLKNELINRINTLGLQEAVFLKGELAYSDFAKAMSNAYLFVGGGTTIVETALCGVPGVMPFAYDMSGDSYGSLYNYPFGNLGMRTAKTPETTIEDEVERIINLPKERYEEEVKMNYEYALAYSMDNSMNNFLKIVSNSSVSRISYRLFFYYYLHSLIERPLTKARRSPTRKI